MERIRQFVSAIISGLMIGVGGTIFLMQENTLAGSFLFSAGLMTILIFGFQLYTGKIGYIPFHKPIYLVEIIITWLGNVTGTYLFAQLIRLTRIYPAMADRVNELVAIKLNDQLGSVFVLSIFCGLLMFIAVDTFKNFNGSMIRFAAVFLPIMVFILSGYEHCIANTYYFSLAGAWDSHCLLVTIVMTLGNSVGGLIIPCYQKLFSIRQSA